MTFRLKAHCRRQAGVPVTCRMSVQSALYMEISRNGTGDIFGTEREPVRPCNFHTVVIGGFVAHRGPFQLKWWLWFLYRPKMVLLVIVTPKYVGLGFYLGEMPHKFINQKQKKTRRKPKKTKKPIKTKKPKKTIPWRKPLGTTFLLRLWFFWFLCFFCFLCFSWSFLFFLSPLADESFGV